MEVQTTLAAHGKYAVLFDGAPNVVSYDFIIASHLSAALQGHLFGRAYFHITPKPPEKHTEFIFAGTSGFPKLKYLEVVESSFGWQLSFDQPLAAGGLAEHRQQDRGRDLHAVIIVAQRATRSLQ